MSTELLDDPQKYYSCKRAQKTLRKVKETRHKWSHVVRIRHVRRKQVYETESRLMVPGADGRVKRWKG